MTTVSILDGKVNKGFGPLTSAKRLATRCVAVGLFALASAGPASAQSATSQLPIPPVVPPSLVPVPASAAPAAAGPTISVQGATLVSSTTPTTTPTTLAIKPSVLGEALVAPQVSPAVAFTGSDVAGPLRLAFTLGLAGAGLVLVTRRRRSA